MAKRPLSGKPAAALFFSVLLQFCISRTPAFADGGSTSAPAPAAESAAPAAAKKTEEAPTQAEEKKPADVAAEAKPAGTEPAGSKAGGDTGAPQEAKSEAKPEGSKAKETGSSAAKPAEAKEKEAPARPRELAPNSDGAGALTVKASNVNAVYRIHWLGAHIGDFKLRSSITNRQYMLQANADISVFFGTVAWHGATSSQGMMTAGGPVPHNYTFRYAANERHEAVEIRFRQRMVQDIIINPPLHPGARSVPITAAHLQNVVDPLSAVVLLSQARVSKNNGDPCNKRLPIFDGKVRYDLVLSPKGTRTVGSTGKLHGTAFVCKVNYVPIAGHKPGKHGGNDYATGNTGIEIWLVPVPEAGLLVPYYVHVPTPAGAASMVAEKFDLETPGGRHALAD